MKNFNINVANEKEAAELVEKCEAEFRFRLDETVKKVISKKNLRVVALSGPTCSGKTTTANRLIEEIGASGHHAVVISIDDFFRDRNDRNRVDLEVPDYDSADAIDLSYLSEFLSRLKNGQSVLVPKYDFTKTRRVGYHEYIPDPLDIYVIEGIQAVYPEITSRLWNYGSIFISVADDVTVNGVGFERHDIRLLRRIVRDYKFRGATPEFSLHLWEGVRKNEERNIFPDSANCGIYIDSFLPYELFVIRDCAISLLDDVPADSKRRAEADRLTKKLSELSALPFCDRMIPQNSVFREFIG